MQKIWTAWQSKKREYAHAPVALTKKGSHWLWALAIPESSKNQQVAQQFITWATSKSYINLVANKEGWVAVPPGTRKSTYINTKYKAAAPFADFVLDSIQTSDPVDSTLKPKPYLGIQYASIPEFTAIGHQVGQIMVQVIDGEISVEQALDDSQEMVFTIMQRSKYY